jgi:hypothetical protein
MNNDKLKSAPPLQIQGALPIRICIRCSEVMVIARTMLNSATGKTIHMFECSCGERAWSEKDC